MHNLEPRKASPEERAILVDFIVSRGKTHEEAAQMMVYAAVACFDWKTGDPRLHNYPEGEGVIISVMWRCEPSCVSTLEIHEGKVTTMVHTDIHDLGVGP